IVRYPVEVERVRDTLIRGGAATRHHELGRGTDLPAEGSGKRAVVVRIVGHLVACIEMRIVGEVVETLMGAADRQVLTQRSEGAAVNGIRQLGDARRATTRGDVDDAGQRVRAI